ncbi:lipopolysaccharide biosynthesis protein [Dyadobacter pollutisoli]|uniref:Lipopolysaccharide biosynthesis protein n=2 Tax=Dyadobacter pollutisoli TaxID=2910158 RepID=A0A9E8N8K7_9BACT|nr:lipopolysaccharide biosynthesis protein [Dyadobacter pollutisoli]WAC11929.1 lipopolysaccharide biosynthesis protein [Dyadobacter pollutisoli]
MNIRKQDALEISIGDLINFIKKYIIFLMLTGLSFAIIGILYSFSLTRLFTAQTVLLPEYNMSSGNSFFSMAVGAEKGGAEKLVPDLYPNILKSTPFGQYLLKQPVTDESGKRYPHLEEYLGRSKQVSLLSRVLSVFKTDSPQSAKGPTLLPSPNILMISREEQGKISSVIGLINITVDDKNGIITLECEMSDPVVAAILVEASKKYLIDYVEEYRTSKTTDQVTFLQERVRESKSRQQIAEYALQSYRDRNRSSFLNVARIEEQRLQADYTLAQSVYSDLVVKLEQAKIKVKEEKPVFKTLEPVQVPTSKSSPKRPLTAITFAVVGTFMALLYIVFFKEKYHLKL